MKLMQELAICSWELISDLKKLFTIVSVAAVSEREILKG